MAAYCLTPRIDSLDLTTLVISRKSLITDFFHSFTSPSLEEFKNMPSVTCIANPGVVLATSLAGAKACFSTVIVRVLLILPEGNTERIFRTPDSVNSIGAE